MEHEIHTEEHFTASDFVRDVIIGMADGLTVPFALAAGLAAGGFGSSHIIVAAGLAEIAAGSISMGLGGYLAAKSQADHYANELGRERQEVETVPDIERKEVAEIFNTYGMNENESVALASALSKDKRKWVDFMMRFELGLEEPDPKRAVRSAMTIACSYAAGGIIPLAPYMILGDAEQGLGVSIAVTLLALAIFGYVRGKFTALTPSRSMVETVLVGGIAATAAFLLARAL